MSCALTVRMVAAIRSPKETVWKPRKVMHTAAALETLAYEIKGLGYDGGAEVRVVMGATGRYYEPVANELHEVWNFVSVVNPKLIKDYSPE